VLRGADFDDTAVRHKDDAVGHGAGVAHLLGL
jgi:hypothetical protein